MSDIFYRLAARAGDLVPRARPQIAPRHAKRAPPPVEDVEIERPYAPTQSAPQRAQAAFDPRQLARETATPKIEPPPLAQAPVAPPVTPREEAKPVSSETPRPTPAIVERTLERPVQSRFERTHTIERAPVAAPPPPMRAPDLAALRPSEAKRGEAETQGHFAQSASAQRTPDLSEASSEAIHVSIGRIEVRAVSAPPRTPPERRKHAPMGLDEYLRRRNEAS